MIIDRARLRDAGLYVCIADNPAGTDQAAAQIIMTGKNKLDCYLNMIMLILK